MANSIHTARWLGQLNGQGWDIHLFPVEDAGIHTDLRNVTVHDLFCYRPPGLDQSVRLVGSWPLSRSADLSKLSKLIVRRFVPPLGDHTRRLARTICRLRPDVIHSLEIQHAGYLTLDARNRLEGIFPTWIVTNWGSDIYLFGRLSEHAERIKATLSACDYYACECHRDVELAKAFGFNGEVFPVLPNTGGFDIKRIQQYRQPGQTSARRLIVLKGYQHWAGRALVGIRAIELAADALKGYRVAVYLARPDVRISAELVSQSTGIPIDIVPYSPHEDMLQLHGRARISIGLSISDAISTSMLEAMIMGSFPIQSNTSCANEWIRDGETGLLVHPEDPEAVAEAIRRAVADDALVDRAADINTRLASERLDRSVIQPQITAMYEKIFAEAEQRRMIC